LGLPLPELALLVLAMTTTIRRWLVRVGVVRVGVRTNQLHCVQKKWSHLMFDNNFRKCGPMFKILSPVNFQMLVSQSISAVFRQSA